MTNLDLILDSIRKKGEEEKNQILKAAEDQAKEIREKSEAEVKGQVDKIIDAAQKEAKQILANEELSASRNARDIKIAAKNELINSIIERLMEELKGLDNHSYKKFVLNRLKDFPGKKADILLRDGTFFDSEDLKGLNVSYETVDDGFIIKDGDVIYDNSFSSIIDYDKDEIKKIISGIFEER